MIYSHKYADCEWLKNECQKCMSKFENNKHIWYYYYYNSSEYSNLASIFEELSQSK